VAGLITLPLNSARPGQGDQLRDSRL